MHREFTTEVERRVLLGHLKPSPMQQAIMWRAQTAVWLDQEQYVPPEVQPLLREGVRLLTEAACLVESDQVDSNAFTEITQRLLFLSYQIAEWSLLSKPETH